MANRILLQGTHTSTQLTFRVRMTVPEGYRLLSSGFEVPSNTSAVVCESRPGPKGLPGIGFDEDGWMWTVRNPNLEEVALTGWILCEQGSQRPTIELDDQPMLTEF